MKKIMKKTTAALLAVIILAFALPICVQISACCNPGGSGVDNTLGGLETPGGTSILTDGRKIDPGTIITDRNLIKDPDNSSISNVTGEENGGISIVALFDRKKGDINGDNEIDVFDATLLLKYSAGTIVLSSVQLDVADVNGDGEVDSADAALIIRYDAGFAEM